MRQSGCYRLEADPDHFSVKQTIGCATGMLSAILSLASLVKT